MLFTPLFLLGILDSMKPPINPPLSWFSPPPEGIPTDRRVTITDEGRVYGYVALRGSCHVGMEGCVEPPMSSPSGFGLAHQGLTMTAEGVVLQTSVIGGGGHAGLFDSELEAIAHYHENIDSALMRVRYGLDDDGLWFAGALKPGITDEEVATVRASAVSGDWRYALSYRGQDFCGACLVNTPGFAMGNAGSSRYSSGRVEHILASGSAMSNGNVFVKQNNDNNGESDMCCKQCDCGKKEEAVDGGALVASAVTELEEKSQGLLERLERMEALVASLEAKDSLKKMLS